MGQGDISIENKWFHFVYYLGAQEAIFQIKVSDVTCVCWWLWLGERKYDTFMW